MMNLINIVKNYKFVECFFGDCLDEQKRDYEDKKGHVSKIMVLPKKGVGSDPYQYLFCPLSVKVFKCP